MQRRAPGVVPPPSSKARWRDASATVGDWELQTGTRIRLAGRERGAELLGEADTYTAQLSPFDLTAKLQARRPGSEDDYLRHAAAQARDFSPSELDRMAGNVRLARAALQRLEMILPLPETIEVVRSTLHEEGGMAGYTRRNVIVLGPRALDARTLAHELFHVMSRHCPATRERLYALLGVRRVAPITLPFFIDENVVTNPDAPLLDTVLRARHEGRELDLTMALLARRPYRGGPLGPYVKPCLLEVAEHGETWSCEWRDGRPSLFARHEIQGLEEKLGTNTSYDIHPEEVSAEHFVLMLAGKGDIPRPDLVGGMYDVLRSTLS